VGATAIHIHDAGLAVADADGVRSIEAGCALVERDRIVTGNEARSQARLKPRLTSTRFWSELSVEPGSAGADLGKSAAELAYAQLQALWQRHGRGATDVLLVVPGQYRTEQLGLLLGLAQECGMPVRAFVDAAAAASTRPYPDWQLVYVDAGLHRVTATLVDQGQEASVRTEHALTQTGLATVLDAFAHRIGDAFVAATRFDPFHRAETEQALYDRLPAWLADFQEQERVELTLAHGEQEFRVPVARESVLGAAAGFYRAVVQLIAQTREPNRPVVVQLSDRLAALPGFVAELARLDDAHVERLPPGHAALAALRAAPAVAQRGAEQVRLLKRLPWSEAPAQPPRAAAKPAPAAAAPRAAAPTHVVYAGTAYRVGADGLLVGREAEPGRRTIVLGEEHGGVSRVHCEVVLRDGELKLKDLSRFGTFVNEKRIAGEATLKRADVIRIGSPGAELTAVGMEGGA
jgi:hypothetical protein